MWLHRSQNIGSVFQRFRSHWNLLAKVDLPLVDQIPELAVGQLLPGASWEVAGYVERTWCPGWLHLSDSCVAGTYLQGIPSEVPLEQSEAHRFHRQTANTARVGVSPAVRSQNHKVVKALKSPVNEVFTSLRCDATVTVIVIIFLLFNDKRLRLRERLQNWPIQASSCNSPDHCCKLDTFQFPEMRFSVLPVFGWVPSDRVHRLAKRWCWVSLCQTSRHGRTEKTLLSFLQDAGCYAIGCQLLCYVAGCAWRVKWCQLLRVSFRWAVLTKLRGIVLFSKNRLFNWRYSC